MSYSFTSDNKTERDDADISNGNFWPVLNMAVFCQLYSIDADLSNEMVLHALIMACGSTNLRLAEFKKNKQAQGIERLEDDSSERINDQPLSVSLYLDAVYSDAKARLIKDSVTTGRRADAENEARTDDEIAQHYHARATAAIAEIQGASSTGVYLI